MDSNIGNIDDIATADTSSKPTRKRKRIVISCTECHRRKQKCDRLLPCSNCVFRNKESACHYETEAAVKKRRSKSANINNSSDGGSQSPIAGNTVGFEQVNSESDSAAQLSALGYAKSNGHNSLGIFKKIEDHEGAGQPLTKTATICQPDFNGLKERYKSLVRQLPARNFVDKLLVPFFQEVNWHYYSIDQEFFMEQLQNWNSVSFSVLNRGPQDLPADIRFFPALLFQVLALALQFQPPHHDPSLDSLKYVSEMSLDDLASDYSESGVAILSLLGKRDITLVTIQAGFLRTSFLKNSGLVTESWHSLGQTIRDAQEIGWHKDPVDRTPNSPEKALEVLWLAELRRRMWLNLQMWDAHMALILGRPTVIDIKDDKISVPIDTLSTKNRRVSAPVPRSESDPPTPLTMLITNTQFLYALRDILSLEKEGVHPKDYTKVEVVHRAIIKSIEHLPPCFRSVNPDTSFDTRPDCQWLPAARQLFDTTGSFTIMTLHKPYAFTNSGHRHEALKACLTILRAQRRLFQYLEAQHYKLFNLVISTFDAIVLLAAIYILHPTENRQYLSDALQHFNWAMERFEKMSYRNQMAKSALGVLQAIHVRLIKAIERSSVKKAANTSSQHTTPPTGPPTTQPAESPEFNISPNGYGSIPPVHGSLSSTMSTSSVQASNTSSMGSSEYSNITDNSVNSSSGVLPSISTPDPNWNAFSNTMPSDFNVNFDFSGIAPLQPMHDLLFNDLVGISDDAAPAMAANAQTFYDSGAPWQFEGEFRDNSFWNFMNQYNL